MLFFTNTTLRIIIRKYYSAISKIQFLEKFRLMKQSEIFQCDFILFLTSVSKNGKGGDFELSIMTYFYN